MKSQKIKDELVNKILELSQQGKSLSFISNELHISKSTASKYAKVSRSKWSGDWIKEFEEYKLGSGENIDLVNKYLSLSKQKRISVRNNCDIFFIENKKAFLHLAGRHLVAIKKVGGAEIHFCSICKETNVENFYKGQFSLCRKCRNTKNATYRKKNSDTIKKEMGGKCIRCGYDEFISSLAFHHLKDKNPDYRNFGIDELREESQKCILLCMNCHNALHAKEWCIK